MINTAKAALVVAAFANSADAFQLSGLQSQAPSLRQHSAAAASTPSKTHSALVPRLRHSTERASFLTKLSASGATAERVGKDVGRGDPEMYKIARDNFARWNSALKEKDYEKVAALYDEEDLSFLPTVSPEFIRDEDKTKEYFQLFIEKQPDGTITEDRVQTFDKNSYLHSGMYTFATGPANARVDVYARFSYCWKKINGNWKIIHHHSSVVPAPAPKEEEMYKIAQDNFARWNNALKEKDYNKVANLYSSQELSFLPTVSPRFIRDSQNTARYFTDFVKKQPAGTITKDTVQVYGPDAYLHSGMYTFEVGPVDARAPVEARFSYMWRKVNGEWKITHHHSSAVPKRTGGAQDEEAAEKMYPIAQENFARWNNALKEKNYEKVASLYSSKELSFLPTVSPKFIKDGKDTKDYFVEFVKKLPDGTITADDVQPYGPDAYLHTGMYTFMTGPADARVPVQARFSYMWRKVNGTWKIVHHHSSAVPNAPAPSPSVDMYALAQQNFKTWNDGLVAKDYNKVASLYYAKDLSFLPTVSPDFIQDGPSTFEYFVNFVKKFPDGTITSDKVQPYGPDAYLHTGMYTFMTGPADARTPVNARFSYMWKQIDGAWRIVHHHSSVVPPGQAKPVKVTVTSAEDTSPAEIDDEPAAAEPAAAEPAAAEDKKGMFGMLKKLF